MTFDGGKRQAVNPYEWISKTIIDHRGWYPVSPLYPLAQLGSARAANLNGDRATARRYYEDFFTLWKDADLIPILIEARAEYAKLK